MYSQKANARKRAVTQSTSLDDQTKKKLESVLLPDYMSSDESVVVSDEDDNPSINSDSENLPAFKGKKLIKHVAVWRSEEFQDYIESLDRKLDRRRSARAKSMILPTDTGEPSKRGSPLDCPEWQKPFLIDRL